MFRPGVSLEPGVLILVSARMAKRKRHIDVGIVEYVRRPRWALNVCVPTNNIVMVLLCWRVTNFLGVVSEMSRIS